VSVAALFLSAVPALGAGIPYGGGGGGGGTVPGLPGTVVTTCTFEGPELICTATIGGFTITVIAPADSLTIGSQIVITSVTNPQAVHCVPLVSFGVGNFFNGSKVTSSFNKPLSVTVSGPGIVPTTEVVQVGSNGNIEIPVMSTTGSLVFSLSADPAFQVDNPSSCGINGATLSVTGKPVQGEELLAAALFGFGVILLLTLRVRRRRLTPSVVRND
jgi:hypothetical protein